MKFTRYQSLFKTNEPEIIEFYQFVSELTTHQPIIDEIRNETVKERKDYLKKNLPGYCFAGIFGTRSDRGFTEHSGMAIIDFDKIPETNYTQEFTAICKLPFILAAWRSPSGNGIKALLKIPTSTIKEHELRLRTFAQYYGSEYLDLDADICRFCFTSYDPNPYINQEAEDFTLMFSEEELNNKAEYNNEIVNAIGDEDKIVKIITKFKRSTEFVEGQRNKHTFSIASHFCEYGVKKQTCIDYLTNHVWSADFTSEGIKAVNSAYKIRKFNSKQLEDREAKVSQSNEISYPFDIFPERIRDSIFEVSRELSLNPIFLATAGLWTCSSLAGNAYTSEFNTKNILFCLMIAPVSVGKTPAFKAMCEQPLSDTLQREDAEFKVKMQEWNEERAEAMADKKQFTKPKPRRFHPFAVDGTTEGYIALCQDQSNGMGVYHDEAETILNAGAHKSNNDSISFFTQAFSGGRYTQIRADREKERVVQNLNINLLMGTQPSRLTNIFTMDKIESGFASRFLMVESDYIQLNVNSDPFAQSRRMCAEWTNLVLCLYDINKLNANGDLEQIKIHITDDAKELYRKYYQSGLVDANNRITNRIDQYIIGAEAKMSAYLPRLTQLIAIIKNPKQPIVDINTVELGYRLYRYHAQSTVKILRNLHKTVETGLPLELDNLYSALPEEFTYKDAKEICAKINLPDDKFKSSIRRKDFSKLFVKLSHGKYKKVH